MLSSITPLGQRGRAIAWRVTATAYLIGSVLGGLALGGLSAALGSLIPGPWRASPWAFALVAALLLVGLGLDTGVLGRRLPSWRRQVDEAWRTAYRGWVVGLGFGLQLGFGLVTIITSATTYAVALCAAWAGDLGAGLLLGGIFGLVRALPTLGLGRVRDRSALNGVFTRLERLAGPADVVAKTSLGAAAAGVVLLGLAGGVSRRG